MSSLSVVVLTLNEARHVKECIASAAAFADELVVIDSYSVDATCEIASESGGRVIRRHFDNYPSQRNAALDLASGEWVLFLDADERANGLVGSEIRSIIDVAGCDATSPVLYWLPRRNYIFGKWIRYTGWSPDYQPRLIRRGRARFDPSKPVHEIAIASGGAGFLKQPIDHFNYSTLTQFRRKQSIYTRLEAQTLYDQGTHARLRSFVGQPLREFVRRFITLEGYKDGLHGLFLSLLMAYYAFVRQRTLWMLWEEKKNAAV